MWVNFIREWWDLQFKVFSERQIVWETFSWPVLFALRVFTKNRRSNIFIFFFFCLTSDLGFEPTHYLHTYIIGHYNPSVRIIDLVSHITYVVCVNFIHKWWDLQFKFDSERQIFLRNFSWQYYLISWCFLFYQKMCTLFQNIKFCVCFLKMFRPLKGWYVLF